MPTVNEVWVQNPPGIVDGKEKVFGLVSKVTQDRVTFTSLTGTRVSTGNRNVMPWTYHHHPKTYQACSWAECPNRAVVQYVRLSTQQTEVVCAAHIPMGVKSEWVTGEKDKIVLSQQSCVSCHQEVVEIFGPVPYADLFAGFSCWTCLTCGLSQVQHPTMVYHPIPEGYAQVGTREERGQRFLILKRKSTHILQPLRSPNVWDYLNIQEGKE